MSTDVAPLTDDAVLDYTQRLRRKYVDTVTNGGVEMPTDVKEAKVLLTALADMDKTAMGKKRLRSEEEQSSQSAQAIAELAAQVAKSIGANRNIPMDGVRAAPQLDDSGMDPLKIVEGETEVGVKSETYEAFEGRQS